MVQALYLVLSWFFKLKNVCFKIAMFLWFFSDRNGLIDHFKSLRNKRLSMIFGCRGICRIEIFFLLKEQMRCCFLIVYHYLCVSFFDFCVFLLAPQFIFKLLKFTKFYHFFSINHEQTWITNCLWRR